MWKNYFSWKHHLSVCFLVWSYYLFVIMKRDGHINLSWFCVFLFCRQEPGSDDEYELFQLYERFYLTSGELGYPLPPGNIFSQDYNKSPYLSVLSLDEGSLNTTLFLTAAHGVAGCSAWNLPVRFSLWTSDFESFRNLDGGKNLKRVTNCFESCSTITSVMDWIFYHRHIISSNLKEWMQITCWLKYRKMWWRHLKVFGFFNPTVKA